MVIIGNVDQIDQIKELLPIDEMWLIVRSKKQFLGHKYSKETIHVPELSPSDSLFRSYLQWKKRGEWNQDKFQQCYVPRFIKEMHGIEARKSLNSLYLKTVKQQRNILLLCFCLNEPVCHRSIVAGLMKGVGAKTLNAYGREIDYSWYYEMYQNTK